MTLIRLSLSLSIILSTFQSVYGLTCTLEGESVTIPPLEPEKDCVDQSYWGEVTHLTKESISIRFPSKESKAKRFLTSETLSAGLIPAKARPWPGSGPYVVVPSAMYRLSDVKLGDWVAIWYAHLDGANICDHIKIQKRPGGRIPPLPEEAESLMRPKPLPSGFAKQLYIPYHERMNAYWDLEDKGIPYPEKFGMNRRFPIAPQPRAVPERRPIQ